MAYRLRVVSKPNLNVIMGNRFGDEGVTSRVQEAAYEVERRAKALAPVDEGRLRASIAASPVGATAWKVGTNVPYGAFQEFGTGTRGRGTDPGPTPATYQHGSRPGHRAQPFLRPALDEVRNALMSRTRWK